MSAATIPSPLPPWRRYLALTKPRILPMVIVTALPVLLLAAGGSPPAPVALGILFGIVLVAAAANTLNMYVERDRDKRMERTRWRPLPSGELAPGNALVFGLALSVAGTALLGLVGGRLAALLGVASILFYVFVYTIWLKPRSAYNAVIGGAAGAAAPLIADAAVNGHVGAAGLSMFAIVFFWHPPHVWAIALYRRADYAAAGIPMLPSVIGDHPTRRRMLWYTLGLVPVTLAPVAHGPTRPDLPGGCGRHERLVRRIGAAPAARAHARGGAPRVPRFAVLTAPTIFPMANGGLGVGGEAGTEAIMPVKRLPNGQMGVSAEIGSTSAPNVIVNIVESPGNGGQTQDRMEGNTRILDVMVEQIKAAVGSDIAHGGTVASAMERTYGLNRAAGAF